MSDKPAVQWIQDSSGNNSCHLNDGRLNFEQSKIGTLVLRAGAWHAILVNGKDLAPEDGFTSLTKARQALEQQAPAVENKPTIASTPVNPRLHPHGVSNTTPRTAQKGRY